MDFLKRLYFALSYYHIYSYILFKCKLQSIRPCVKYYMTNTTIFYQANMIV